jgi:8-oxo-dGTP pyrophosphatase MutT (NUDIX family)
MNLDIIIDTCIDAHASGILVTKTVNGVTKVLAVKTPERGSNFPFGKVETGESTVQCAIRECYEETGVIVHILPNTKPFRHKVNGKMSVLYKAELVLDTGNPTDDAGKVLWEDPPKLRKSIYSEFNSLALAHFNVN